MPSFNSSPSEFHVGVQVDLNIDSRIISKIIQNIRNVNLMFDVHLPQIARYLGLVSDAIASARLYVGVDVPAIASLENGLKTLNN